MKYSIYTNQDGEFMVFQPTSYGDVLMKIFKTYEDAENWIKKNS